jgi:hypothetical protein
MARKPAIDESKLTKGELRKLNALRKSVGDGIGERTFAAWQRSRPAAEGAAPADKTAEAIAGAVLKLIESGKISGLPRGGYVVRRGRGRVVVKPAA